MIHSISGFVLVVLACLGDICVLCESSGSDDQPEVAVPVAAVAQQFSPLQDATDLSADKRQSSFARILRSSPSSFSRILRSRPSSFSRILRTPSSFSRILRSDPDFGAFAEGSHEEDSLPPRYLRDMSFTRILRSPPSPGSSFSRILRSPSWSAYDYSSNMPEMRNPSKRSPGSSSFSRILRSRPSSFTRILRRNPSSFSRILKRGGGANSFSRILRSPGPYLDHLKEHFLDPEEFGYDQDDSDDAEEVDDADQPSRDKRSQSFSRILRGDDYSRLSRDSSFSRIL